LAPRSPNGLRCSALRPAILALPAIVVRSLITSGEMTGKNLLIVAFPILGSALA
jgi:hypothetical protein